MSRNNGKGAKLEQKINPSRGGPSRVSNRSSSSSPTSPPSSCVSSESDQGRKSNSPEAESMLLAGCPRCLMYVMLSEKDPKCPKCNSTVLVDFNDSKKS